MFYFNYYYYFAALLGMQDLSSWTRDGTHAPAVEVRSLNHWTAGEVPRDGFLTGWGQQETLSVSVCESWPLLGIVFEINE